MLTPRLLFGGPADAAPIVVLAHGAGAAMDSPFLGGFAGALAAAGFRVARFEFPYMQLARATGTRRPPDRMPMLLDTWRAVIDSLGARKLVIGGKSMGGRVASMLADEARVRGLLCLGYPFHAPGKPAGRRIAHLSDMNTPTLIVQGTRDTMGRRQEVEAYALSPAVRVAWIEDGDHSFVPRKTSGRTIEANMRAAIDAATAFLSER